MLILSNLKGRKRRARGRRGEKKEEKRREKKKKRRDKSSQFGLLLSTAKDLYAFSLSTFLYSTIDYNEANTTIPALEKVSNIQMAKYNKHLNLVLTHGNCMMSESDQ